jgi:hypothetical protein
MWERKTYEVEAAGGRVQVQLRTASEIGRLDEKHRRGRHPDPAAFNAELFSDSVVGWQGGFFEGKECTPAAKRELYDVHTDLAGEILEKAVAARTEDREAQRGNSSAS